MPTTPDGPPEAQAHDATLAALTATRAIIAAGWTQGAFQREVDGVMCHCLTAAATMAETGKSFADWQRGCEVIDFSNSLTIPKLHDAIGDKGDFKNPAQNLTAWNDHPCRTQDDVFALIDRAIAARQVTA
jgi:hypothetical protein